MCSAWQSWGVGKLLERVEHLVVEDGEVEHQNEANWMRGLHLMFFFSIYRFSFWRPSPVLG